MLASKNSFFQLNEIFFTWFLWKYFFFLISMKWVFFPSSTFCAYVNCNHQMKWNYTAEGGNGGGGSCECVTCIYSCLSGKLCTKSGYEKFIKNFSNGISAIACIFIRVIKLQKEWAEKKIHFEYSILYTNFNRNARDFPPSCRTQLFKMNYYFH